MPLPPLEKRPPCAVDVSRRKALSARGKRIVETINAMNVTFPSVARRAGYDPSTIQNALLRGGEKNYALDCVEIALGIPVWEGRQ